MKRAENHAGFGVDVKLTAKRWFLVVFLFPLDVVSSLNLCWLCCVFPLPISLAFPKAESKNLKDVLETNVWCDLRLHPEGQPFD